ncbi:MAG: HTTM domain-containing protein [Trueperaceae bacterium]|nr:HTTM domain-containing protein [Trueperaceae bacterium]
MRRLEIFLNREINPASLVFFRVAFGLIIFWDTVRHFIDDLIGRYWIEPSFHFQYTGFAWVQPLPGPYLYVLWVLIGLAALAVSAGFYYRFATLFLGFTLSYFFLIEEARYMNHSYLIILLCFIMALLPLNQVIAFDQRRLKSNRKSLPYWPLAILQFHIALPYFFGGIAKLQSDWLRGQPLGLWLGGMTDLPVIGKLLGFHWTALLFSYSGLLIDLFAVPLLFWKRSRVFIFIILCSFHFLNSHLFIIDIFPWFMIAGTSLFFEPDWPLELYRHLRSSRLQMALYAVLGLVSGSLAVYLHGFLNPLVFLIGFLAGSLSYFAITHFNNEKPEPARKSASKGKRAKNERADFSLANRPVLVGFLTLWVLVQIALPFRHFFIPGNSIWTEEGHRFAWHMMLRSKQGSITYLVDNLRTGEQLEVDPLSELTYWQYNRFENAPDLIAEYARHLHDSYQQKTGDDFRVRARTLVSLNGRKAQPIIDSSIDLGNEPEAIWHASWILPLREALPNP